MATSRCSTARSGAPAAMRAWASSSLSYKGVQQRTGTECGPSDRHSPGRVTGRCERRKLCQAPSRTSWQGQTVPRALPAPDPAARPQTGLSHTVSTEKGGRGHTQAHAKETEPVRVSSPCMGTVVANPAPGHPPSPPAAGIKLTAAIACSTSASPRNRPYLWWARGWQTHGRLLAYSIATGNAHTV
jgi:hypothetical protein